MAEQRVRDLVNSPRRSLALRSEVPRWNKVTSALDTIGDTDLAVDAYLQGRVEASDHGLLYLAIYGILQVLLVQQDALPDLADGLGLQLELPPALLEIREVRDHASEAVEGSASAADPARAGVVRVGKAEPGGGLYSIA